MGSIFVEQRDDKEIGQDSSPAMRGLYAGHVRSVYGKTVQGAGCREGR